MDQTIQIIPLKVPCYLVSIRDGFALIDCGDASDRGLLEKELSQRGVKPGSLKLVLLTHGDFDHTGNAAFLQQAYAAKIAMHAADAGMISQADMSWGRKARPDRVTLFGRFIGLISPLFAGRAPFETFIPDLCVEDGQDLSGYGFDARVIGLPGHSKGSIGVMTSGGALFCGDLLSNMVKLGPHFMIDDLAAFTASVEKLKSLPIGMVYPGHGKPFPLERFMKKYR
jgi:hydroxyacylglutathione hydrolase